MLGRGEGTANWGGRDGRIEWTNFPPRRPDGVYLWLNDRWGYEEGELDRKTLGFRTVAYVLHPELPRRRRTQQQLSSETATLVHPS
jgi:hypothetical protein